MDTTNAWSHRRGTRSDDYCSCMFYLALSAVKLDSVLERTYKSKNRPSQCRGAIMQTNDNPTYMLYYKNKNRRRSACGQALMRDHTIYNPTYFRYDFGHFVAVKLVLDLAVDVDHGHVWSGMVALGLWRWCIILLYLLLWLPIVASQLWNFINSFLNKAWCASNKGRAPAVLPLRYSPEIK